MTYLSSTDPFASLMHDSPWIHTAAPIGKIWSACLVSDPTLSSVPYEHLPRTNSSISNAPQIVRSQSQSTCSQDLECLLSLASHARPLGSIPPESIKSPSLYRYAYQSVIPPLPVALACIVKMSVACSSFCKLQVLTWYKSDSLFLYIVSALLFP